MNSSIAERLENLHKVVYPIDHKNIHRILSNNVLLPCQGDICTDPTLCQVCRDNSSMRNMNPDSDFVNPFFEIISKLFGSQVLIIYDYEDQEIVCLASLTRENSETKINFLHYSSEFSSDEIFSYLMRGIFARIKSIISDAVIVTTNLPMHYDMLAAKYCDKLICMHHKETMCILLLTDENIDRVQSRKDCENLEKSVDNGRVCVIHRKVSDMTASILTTSFEKMRDSGIEKLMVYYTGCGENLGDSEFPTIILNNSEPLSYARLREILCVLNFDFLFTYRLK